MSDTPLILPQHAQDAASPAHCGVGAVCAASAPARSPAPDVPTPHKPEILAPAGDTSSFLAALAAGADAVYLGLKHFSARMQAENFGLGELSRLTDLAHGQNARVYVAMNTLVKPNETAAAYRLAARLARQVRPDGLIIQDLAMLDLARQAGYEGGLFLSTLANLTHPEALLQARDLGADRVILPRELSIDEIRLMGEACPQGLDLECFIHGALCYCVSGRCYWSSYMGGKSGLRGRCVQPCRRVYRQGGPAVQALALRESRNAEKEERPRGRNNVDAAPARPPRRQTATRGKEHSGRWFSCLDLSLDVLAKTLLHIPHLVSWKIEGRKKGPHYVYHAVTAYRMLRDHPGDPKARKMAEEILEMALGRPGSRARFLPQKNNLPISPGGQTNSGLLAGNVRVEADGRVLLKPHFELLPQDYLRVGVEDERWHATLPVTRRIPKAGSLILRLPKHKTPKAGTPVFLIDRREPELMRLLKEWQSRLESLPVRSSRAVEDSPSLPRAVKPRPRPDMVLRASLPQGRETRSGRNQLLALWLSPRSADISRTVAPRVSWWLPPVVWPEEEEVLRRLISRLWREGARHFVCNAPWQRGLFPGGASGQGAGLPPDADLLAGPFCNAANAAALGVLARMGFSGAFVSPELAREDMLALPGQSPLPLGAVLGGFWPVGISRFGLLGVKANEPFLSPKGEVFWARQYAGNIWIYPGWPLDLTAKRQELATAGYGFFVQMQENPPAALPELRRQGLFNWEGSLL